MQTKFEPCEIQGISWTMFSEIRTWTNMRLVEVSHSANGSGNKHLNFIFPIKSLNVDHWLNEVSFFNLNKMKRNTR